MEFWAEHSGIMISNLGNSRDPITEYRGRNVIRKTVTINGKTVQKRYQVARLVLECFPPDVMMQCAGLGNHEGKGTVVWKDGNELNDSADNLMWKWDGPGWTEAQMKKRRGYIKRALEELNLTEKYPEYYADLKENQ